MTTPKELSLWIEEEGTKWLMSLPEHKRYSVPEDDWGYGALAMANHLLNPTSNCPCGKFITADTEDWQIPRCQICYDELWPEMEKLKEKNQTLVTMLKDDQKDDYDYDGLKQDALKLVEALKKLYKHCDYIDLLELAGKTLEDWNEKHGGEK